MPNITNQDNRTTSTIPLKCLYCYFQTDVTPCSSTSSAEFKQGKAVWAEAANVIVLLQRCPEPVQSLMLY